MIYPPLHLLLGYAAFAFLPPILWLIVYLREDDRPEPFYLIVLTFIGGIAAAFAALILQNLLLAGIDPFRQFLILFAAIALIEETMKFLAVRLLAAPQKAFDEPVDAMIYMVTAGLGFAAIENFLFLFLKNYDPSLVLGENFIAGAQLTAARFIGANQLHALASAVLGYFFAKSWFGGRKSMLVLGIILASALHASFNYLIIVKDEIPGSFLFLATLLGLALIMVLVDFHRLKAKLA